ncbi:TonB-dependent receptor [Dyadobacter chenhuakuii]|uniref:TonB-dependent receptor n=1 Tax=Dyadobacter chenhuakuii TaxID=2909339 RepID=A0A9X1QH17_9BACT|nr:TonB-dependent receptor [Dyadobacter chenhuakuii]MCF2500729.1 TonB-dependent receptor [Dyadobacter chenhuakuii]
MKLTILLLWIGMMGVHATGYSQKSRMDVAIRNGNLGGLFKLIQEKTDYRIFYKDGLFSENGEGNLNLNLKNETVPAILTRALKGTDLTFKIIGKQIAVFKKDEESKSAAIKSLPAPEAPVANVIREITGTIQDMKGGPLPGATVIVKGTDKGTSTDATGKFSIEAEQGDVLVISFIGYLGKELVVGTQTAVNIQLEEDLGGLEEVVIVGFGSQRKATITGSIATITTEDLKQSPTASITNALAGRLPGLFANQFGGGEPGVDRSDIFIRGTATYGNQAPIVIIDGLERSMDYLAPSEIETFTILKDASATAPYGVRGANGVILITTKRGKVQDKATVNFKGSVGVNQPVKFPTYLGSADYAMLYNEARRNDSPDADPSTLNLFSESAITNFRKAKGDNSDGLGYNWNYFDYAFKPGVQHDYSLSISGGSVRARYFVLANYFQQDGNYKHTNMGPNNTQAVFKRYNFRSNIDIDITDNFFARLDIGARITDRNAPGTSAARIVEMANTQPSYLPITLEPNGNPANRVFEANNPLGMLYGDQIYRFNILGELSRTGFLNDKNTYLNGSFSLGHKLDFITKGLSIDGVFSYDASDGAWIRRDVTTYSEGYREYPGYATFVPEQGSDIYREPGIYTGAYKSGNKYDIDQTIRNQFDNKDNENRSYVQAKLDYLRNFGMHDVTGMVLVNRSKRIINNQVPFSYQGITARATYGYDDRYLFEFNAAYNGSENFAKGKRYGFFPSVSAGWVLSKEQFMSSTQNWLNSFKIRGSYGLVGSDRVPNDRRFIYLQYFSGREHDYNFGTDNFGSGAGGYLYEGDLANPDLTWEKARKANIGIDATFLKHLTVTLDLFHEHRYDIITDMGGGDKLGFPDIVGKDAPYINSGIVNNRGFDLEVGWSGSIGKDATYFIRPNLSFARNNIVFMNEIPYAMSGRANTGKRIGEHFNYAFDHFVKNQEEANELNAMNSGGGYQSWGTLRPGDVVYKDLNGDGKIDDLGDRTAMGNPRNPEIMFGLPVGAKYKGFDFSMLFQGAARASVQLSGAAVYDFPLFNQDKYGKVKPMHLDRWTPETAETATYPALHFGDHSNNKNGNSSLFLYNSKYIRLKTIELGYNLPKAAIKKIGIEQVRFYAQGLNLMTWDGLKKVDMDPETREGTGDWYPIQKVLNFGVDLTF